MKVEIYNVDHVIIFGFINPRKNNEVLTLKHEIISEDIEIKAENIEIK